jgi:hypothetical protein
VVRWTVAVPVVLGASTVIFHYILKWTGVI